MILIEVTLSALDWRHRVISALDTCEPGADPARGFLARLHGVSGSVTALRTELVKARDSGLPFGPDLCDLMFTALDRLQIESGPDHGGTSTTPGLRPILADDQIRRDYLHWLDRYAARLYTENPAALPAVPRGLFETWWAWHADRECGWLGGTLPQNVTNAGMAAKPVALLHLPSSRLMGWKFDHRGSFGVYLDADALAQGDVSSAFGTDPC